MCQAKETAMRILYDSKLPQYKTPFGTLTPGQVCTVHIHIPCAVGTTAVTLLLKYEDGKSFDIVMLAIGNFDTMTSLFYPAIEQKLTQTGIEHLSKTYQGGHDPSVWRAALFDFVQLIFTEN